MTGVRVIKRHIFPMKEHREMLEWLVENIQDNYYPNLEKYTGSATSQYIEWRSKDKLSWILRLAGNPPKCQIEIKDEQKEILFLLRWR